MTQSTKQKLTWVLFAGSLIALISFGVRSSFGLLKIPMAEATGFAPWVFAWSLSLQNLMWGVMQPVAGYFADRYGSWRVLVVGALIYGSGLLLMVMDTGPLLKFVSIGFLVGSGIAGTSFSLVMVAFVKLVHPQYRSLAASLGTAAGSLGQVLVVPMATLFIEQAGWVNAGLFMAALFGFSIPLSLVLREKNEKNKVPGISQNIKPLPAREAMRQAFGNRSYLMLMSGFFACGYLLAFVTVYLPQHVGLMGLPSSYAAAGLMLIGLFNIVGSLSAGALGMRFSNKWLLSLNYIIRAVSVIGLLTLASPAVTILGLDIPKMGLTLIFFAIIMGLMWLSTVPPTMNLVAIMHGTPNLAMLYGWVFFMHQVGAFIGLILAGWIETRYSSVTLMWWSCVGVNIFAALIHLPIKEKAHA